MTPYMSMGIFIVAWVSIGFMYLMISLDKLERRVKALEERHEQR